MATKIPLNERAKAEAQIEEELRLRVLEFINRNHITEAQMAELLGITPFGAEMLVRSETWPLSLAIRIAEALGLQVTFEANAKPAN